MASHVGYPTSVGVATWDENDSQSGTTYAWHDSYVRCGTVVNSGKFVSYDLNAGHLKFVMPSGSTITVTAGTFYTRTTYNDGGSYTFTANTCSPAWLNTDSGPAAPINAIGSWSATALPTATQVSAGMSSAVLSDLTGWARSGSSMGVRWTHNVPSTVNGYIEIASGQTTGDSYISLTYSTNVAPTVSLSTPANAAVVTSKRPPLTALATDPDSSQTVSSRFQIASDSGFATIVVENGSGYGAPTVNAPVTNGSITWTPTADLAEGTTYYWRVAVTDGTDSSAWTAGRSLKVAKFPAAAITGAGALTPALKRNRLAASALTGAGALSAALLRKRFAASALTGVGSTGAALTRARLTASALAGSGAVSAATLSYARVIAAALTGSASATGALARTRVMASALTGDGHVDADALRLRSAQAALAGGGGVAGPLAAIRSLIADVTGAGHVQATAVAELAVAAALVGDGEVVADVVNGVVIAAALSGRGDMTAHISALIHMLAELHGEGWITDAQEWGRRSGTQPLVHVEVTSG